MIILPNENYDNKENEKIQTYQFLAHAGCPVFNSVLFEQDEQLDDEKISKIKTILNSEYCTVRYQYVKPALNPIKGGNKSKISISELNKRKVGGTLMWLLESIDRTKNLYGINVYVNRIREFITVEIVGKGFDVSDLNRGDISPQEQIYFEYPIITGWNGEWWKYIKVNINDDFKYQNDKVIRLKKLEKFDLIVNRSIFNDKFIPLPYEFVELLIKHINNVDSLWENSTEYVISISVNEDNKLVFWDIQTPKGKQKILRR